MVYIILGYENIQDDVYQTVLVNEEEYDGCLANYFQVLQ